MSSPKMIMMRLSGWTSRSGAPLLEDGRWGMMIIPGGTIVTKSRRLPDQDGRWASKAGTHPNDLPPKKPHEWLLPRV